MIFTPTDRHLQSETQKKREKTRQFYRGTTNINSSETHKKENCVNQELVFFCVSESQKSEVYLFFMEGICYSFPTFDFSEMLEYFKQNV